MPDPITPDTVRALLDDPKLPPGPWEWSIWAGRHPARLCTEAQFYSGEGWFLQLDKDRVNAATAALIAAAPALALAYLDAIAERDRLREIVDDSPPPADAGLLALANRTLAADLETVRAERDRLARVLAAERLDPDAGPPGWVLCGRQWVRNSSGARPLCSVRPLASPFDPRPVRYEWRVYPLAAEIGGVADTALEAMEAADRAGGSDV